MEEREAIAKINEVLSSIDAKPVRAASYELVKGFDRFYCGCGNWVDVPSELIYFLRACKTAVKCPHCNNIFFDFEKVA